MSVAFMFIFPETGGDWHGGVAHKMLLGQANKQGDVGLSETGKSAEQHAEDTSPGELCVRM